MTLGTRRDRRSFEEEDLFDRSRPVSPSPAVPSPGDFTLPAVAPAIVAGQKVRDLAGDMLGRLVDEGPEREAVTTVDSLVENHQELTVDPTERFVTSLAALDVVGYLKIVADEDPERARGAYDRYNGDLADLAARLADYVEALRAEGVDDVSAAVRSVLDARVVHAELVRRREGDSSGPPSLHVGRDFAPTLVGEAAERFLSSLDPVAAVQHASYDADGAVLTVRV